MTRKLLCTDQECRAARPERCTACQARRLFKDTKTVSIRNEFSGERATNVRVLFADGSFIDNEVTGEDR